MLCAGVARAQVQKGEDESADLVEEGRKDLVAHHYDDAAKELDQALALNPRRIDAYVLRAAVHAAKKEFADGIALLEKAKALDPGNLDVLAGLGGELVLDGKGDQGVPMLEQVVAKDPKRFEAQSLLGKHYARGGEWARAVTALEGYLAARPDSLQRDDLEHQGWLAEAYLRSDRAQDAVALYKKILAARPTEASARMGLAWSLAAIDCTQAKPEIAKLADLEPDHPEILLVAGQCDLALGDAKTALRAGQKYLASASPPSASGYALVGEAAAANGDLATAKESLGKARDLDPGDRRWSVKLADVLRRAGDGAGAMAELERVGAPNAPADDPAWWHELGETLIVSGRSVDVAARLEEARTALPKDAGLAAIAGEAAVRAGDADAAIADLDGVDGDRAHAWLARALLASASAKLGADDLAGAIPLLTRADGLPGATEAEYAAIERDLGVAQLASGKLDDAIAALAHAIARAPQVETLLAYGQALARAGKTAAARDAYRQAAGKAHGDAAVEVAVELAAFELDANAPADALDALDAAAAAAKKAPAALAEEYRAASLAAHHAGGVAALRAGAAGRAVSLLEAADKLAGGKDDGVRCDLAVATVASGDRAAAKTRLAAVAKTTCPFPAPADTQAVPILIAFTDGLDPRNADKALAKLGKLAGKATGASRRLLAVATRVVALGAAERAYQDGKLAKARKALEQAKRAETRAGADELAHNLAVLDVADGKLDAAAAALEKLAPTLPEALVNLGVIDDRKGDGAGALEEWSAAKAAGVKFAPLEDWIAAKQRIYGGAK